MTSVVDNSKVKESTFKHEGKSVFYIYPNKGNDPVDYLESWIGDYVSDEGAESGDLYEGVAKYSPPTEWELALSGIDPILLNKRDLVLVPFEGGWVYARIEDLMINPTDSFICKLNTVQYYCG